MASPQRRSVVGISQVSPVYLPGASAVAAPVPLSLAHQLSSSPEVSRRVSCGTQDCHTSPLSGGAAAAAAQSRVVLLPLSHAS